MSKRCSRQSNVKLDEVFTPYQALMPLIPYLPKDWVIWECAFGQGHLAKHLINLGYKTIGEGGDFFNTNLDCDVLVTNPPYSLKDEFLTRAYQLNIPFAFLLPLTALEGKRRGYLYREKGIQLIIPNKRINFIIPSGKTANWFQTAWFCYKLNLPKDLMFVDL